MTVWLVSDNASSRVGFGGAAAGATSILLAAGSGGLFPSPGPGQAFKGRVGSNSLHEPFVCDGRTGDTLHLSAPLAGDWPEGATVMLPFTASVFEALVQRAELGTAAFQDGAGFATAAQGAKADTALQTAGNLSGLGNVATARANLGLGDAATKNTGTTAGTVCAGDDSRLGASSAKLSAIDALAWAANKLIVLTGAATASVLSFPAWAQSFMSAADAAAGRTALGLGGASILSVGTVAGTVAEGHRAFDGAVLEGKTFASPGTLAAGAYADISVPVTGVVLGDFIVATAATVDLGGATLDGLQCGTDTATLRLRNGTASSIAIPSGGGYAARVQKNTIYFGDPYSSSVVLLLKFDGFSNGSTPSSVDLSPAPHTATWTGSAAINTASPYKGDGCMSTAASSHLSFANSADWTFGSGAFTLEAFIRISSASVSATVLARHPEVSGYGPFVVEVVSGKVYGMANGGAIYLTGPSLSVDTWTHVVLQRTAAGVVQLVVNGVLAQSAAYGSTALSADNSPLYVGTAGAMTLDMVRITKGVCRYTALPFNPATVIY